MLFIGVSAALSSPRGQAFAIWLISCGCRVAVAGLSHSFPRRETTVMHPRDGGEGPVHGSPEPMQPSLGRQALRCHRALLTLGPPGGQ